ncbi:MAG: hypothetical protein WAQ24_02185 [Candidatus Saccharimonadales bacterium]
MASKTQNTYPSTGPQGSRILEPGEAVTGPMGNVREVVGQCALTADGVYPPGTPGGAGSRESMAVQQVADSARPPQ